MNVAKNKAKKIVNLSRLKKFMKIYFWKLIKLWNFFSPNLIRLVLLEDIKTIVQPHLLGDGIYEKNFQSDSFQIKWSNQ